MTYEIVYFLPWASLYEQIFHLKGRRVSECLEQDLDEWQFSQVDFN